MLSFKDIFNFKSLFGFKSTLKECPRCLGKGHVDQDDIKRLNQELIWTTGTCAYCDGLGKVDSKINLPAETSYLVNDLSKKEREKIRRNHPDAIKRGKQLEEETLSFIRQVRHLHFDLGLTSSQITDSFLTAENNLKEHEIEAFRNYIETIIEKN